MSKTTITSKGRIKDADALEKYAAPGKVVIVMWPDSRPQFLRYGWKAGTNYSPGRHAWVDKYYNAYWLDPLSYPVYKAEKDSSA